MPKCLTRNIELIIYFLKLNFNKTMFREGGGLGYFGLRTVLLLASTTFSILVVMMLLNIITVDDIIVMFKLSPEGANALRLIYDRIQEVTHNIIEILNQLLNKLFSWAGIDVDLSKIKIDVNNTGASPDKVNPNVVNPAVTDPNPIKH